MRCTTASLLMLHLQKQCTTTNMSAHPPGIVSKQTADCLQPDIGTTQARTFYCTLGCVAGHPGSVTFISGAVQPQEHSSAYATTSSVCEYSFCAWFVSVNRCRKWVFRVISDTIVCWEGARTNSDQYLVQHLPQCFPLVVTSHQREDNKNPRAHAHPSPTQCAVSTYAPQESLIPSLGMLQQQLLSSLPRPKIPWGPFTLLFSFGLKATSSIYQAFTNHTHKFLNA